MADRKVDELKEQVHAIDTKIEKMMTYMEVIADQLVMRVELYQHVEDEIRLHKEDDHRPKGADKKIWAGIITAVVTGISAVAVALLQAS